MVDIIPMCDPKTLCDDDLFHLEIVTINYFLSLSKEITVRDLHTKHKVKYQERYTEAIYQPVTKVLQFP